MFDFAGKEFRTTIEFDDLAGEHCRVTGGRVMRELLRAGCVEIDEDNAAELRRLRARGLPFECGCIARPRKPIVYIASVDPHVRANHVWAFA